MEIAEVFIACKKEVHYSRELILAQPALIHVVSGEVRIAGAEGSASFFAGDTVLLPRNQVGRVSKMPLDGAPCVVISILFRRERLQEYYSAIPGIKNRKRSDRVKQLPAHPLLKSLFNSLAPYFDLDDALPGEIAALKVQEAIRILRAVDQSVDGQLLDTDEPGKLDLVDFMEKNYMFNLPLAKFGYLTGRSLTTFKKDFGKSFNETPGRWLTQKRLELARYQIFEKKQKPSEVYLNVGFENLSHFSFAFKKHFGYSPGVGIP